MLALEYSTLKVSTILGYVVEVFGYGLRVFMPCEVVLHHFFNDSATRFRLSSKLTS